MRQTCSKSGIKIHETNNNNSNAYNVMRQSQLQKPVNYYITTLDSLDLDLEHYSLTDLYKLFNIEYDVLNEDTLKNAKQIVLKMHPDKSRLDSKYFLFFSKAYKHLYSIYEFQNKSVQKKYKDEDFFDESNRTTLNMMFEQKKEFKDSKNFNNWFNESFEKNRMEDPLEQGYGDWLKSNDDFIGVNENISKSNMNEVFEQKKKQMQAVMVYTGVTDTFASTLGGSLLNGSDNFSTEEYTDLRQAYTETLIPVTQEDYNKMHKFNNISEYKRHRDGVDVSPLSKEEAEKKLYMQQRESDKQSAALAFKYAKQSEKAKQSEQSFWGDIKRLTGL
jgi:hypothetical protein